MLRNILVIALCLGLMSCKGIIESYKRSNSGVSALDKKVLFDFRNPVAAAVPQVAPETQKQVLGAIPPGSCPVAPHQPPRIPRVAAVVNGSFTYAAETETAYLVTGTPCGSGNKLLVFSSGKLQVQSDTAFSSILNMFDLNHDDQNELLMSVANIRDGVTDREAALVNYEKNSLHTVEDFGTVYHDSCGVAATAADGGSRHVDAVAVYYLPRPEHQLPSFTVERYRAACPTTPGAPPTGWTRVGAQ